MKLAISSLAIVMFGFSSFSLAGVLLEPYVGYQTGNIGTSSLSYGTSGVDYGARLGYQATNWMFGADYTSGSWTQNSTPTQPQSPSDIGAFLGYQGMAWRGYVEYVVSSSMAYTTSPTTTYTGTGVKVGVGYKFKPWLAVNANYLSDTYTAISGQSGNLTNNVTAGTYGLEVSFPFNL
jgi:predicted porin